MAGGAAGLPSAPARYFLHGARHLHSAKPTKPSLQPPLCPGLQSLHLCFNNLDKLPPALAAATGLTELSLAYNQRLALTAADADAVVRHWPLLCHIDLKVTRTPAHVLARLSECAPQLQISETQHYMPWEEQE